MYVRPFMIAIRCAAWGLFSGMRPSEARHFRIRQHVAKQDIRVAYLGTDYNVADFFTKGLTNPKFKDFRHMLGLRSLTAHPVSHFMSFLGLTLGI